MSFIWIDKYIEGIIEHCHSRDIFEIYDTLEIDIRKINSNNYLLQGSDAIYVRDYFDSEIVFIRDDLPYKYEKFILAHELGHAILHTDVQQASYNRSLINKGKLEKQADYFGLKLLDINLDTVYYYDKNLYQLDFNKILQIFL